MKLTMPARLAALAIAGVALTGCTVVNPITTQMQYDASDGVGVDLGEVRAQNLLVVTEAEGSPAVLIGTLSNLSATEDATVAITVGTGSPVEVDVPAGESVTLGVLGEEEVAVEGTASAQPGLLGDVQFNSTQSGLVSLDVPVMDGTLPEYAATLDAIG